MSDSSQGDGWWLASDGRWYPPDLHPSAAPQVSSYPPPFSAYAGTPGFASEHQPAPTAYGPVVSPYAPYGSRVLAFLIDWLIVSAVVTVVGIPLHIFHVSHYSTVSSNGAVSHGVWLNVTPLGILIDAVVAISLGTLFIGAKGQTPGMAALKIRVVDSAGGGFVSYGRAFGRAGFEYLLAVLLFIPWVIDVLFPLWDSRSQTLHDKVASTVVVKVEEPARIHQPRNLADLNPM